MPIVDNGTGEQIQIPAQIPQQFVDDCQQRLAANPNDKGCEMLIEASQGDIPPGIYPESEADAALASPRRAGRFRIQVARTPVPKPTRSGRSR